MDTQETKLFKNWWLLAIKGLLTLVFGLVALTLPDINQIKIIKFFCAVLIASGLLLSHGAFFNMGRKLPWKWWFFEGVFDFTFGGFILFTIINHRMRAMAFSPELIAAWTIVFGIIQIITAFRFKKFSIGWFALLLSGLVALSFSVVIFLNILPGTQAKTMVIGYFAIFLGLVIIVNANKLRLIHSNNF